MIVKKTVFDLKSFAEVTIGIDFIPSPSFTALTEALTFYGNDETKILAALNQDKVAREIETAKSTPLASWHTFADDEETTLNGPADVTPVNEKLVNDLVLNIAKQHYGFSKDLDIEKKRAAKALALEFVRNTPELRGYLTYMSAGPSATSPTV